MIMDGPYGPSISSLYIIDLEDVKKVTEYVFFILRLNKTSGGCGKEMPRTHHILSK